MGPKCYEESLLLLQYHTASQTLSRYARLRVWGGWGGCSRAGRPLGSASD